MNDFHTVHIAPTLPEVLKKTAYNRLEVTARRVRVAHLGKLFNKFGLRIDDIFEVEGNIWTPKPDVKASKESIATLTTQVRLLCTLWESVRPSQQDGDPEELALKIADYLDVASHVGPRLQRWANTHASRHVGPPAFEKLDSPSRDLLRMGSGALRLTGPQTDHALDELVAKVHAHAPWHSRATTSIWHHLRASRRQGRVGLSLPPLLLHGPPGTGKSTLARLLAQLANVPHIELDVGAGTAAFRIVGVESGWGTRQIGDVVRLVYEGRVANPIIIINEVDKIGTGKVSGSGTRTSMSDALLPLLEAGTAARFRCPASGLDHHPNARQINNTINSP